MIINIIIIIIIIIIISISIIIIIVGASALWPHHQGVRDHTLEMIAGHTPPTPWQGYTMRTAAWGRSVAEAACNLAWPSGMFRMACLPACLSHGLPAFLYGQRSVFAWPAGMFSHGLPACMFCLSHGQPFLVFAWPAVLFSHGQPACFPMACLHSLAWPAGILFAWPAGFYLNAACLHFSNCNCRYCLAIGRHGNSCHSW